jgi:hypothetical protein
MTDRLKGQVAIVGGTLSGLFMTAFVLAGSASAQTADPAETAITDFGSKVTTYGAAMIGVVVLAAGILLGVKYLKKAAGKA